MPRDYRRSSQSQPSKRKQSRSCVWWLIVGIAVGVVATKILAPGQDAAEPATETAARESASPSRPKPSFKFEEILTQAEDDDDGKAPPLPPPAPRPQPPVQEKPATPEPAQARAVEPAPTPAPAAKPRRGSYVVQVGSFSRAADAERLKAQLAMLGVSTSVQAATLSNGRVTHRVRTGGYASRAEAKKVQALLKRHGKDSLAIPVK
ncbi:SPOR domain-containing protein [Thiorhodococcus minor]|uniref:SPOR domain-containing protein n=1 Tax=Thiorhodococcus minor TaxID=57489 RepID=A0A6M0JST9_9GAMM|nr:SPOR domain-containing protein [Thiorhodococcus minor]NEV60590.1 SPOR domain-containing protein [Thiorhodococcus minor]